jgi:hypothetical protein
MAHDSNAYLIETLGQLVEAKKEATALRDRVSNLEEDLSQLTERNRLNLVKNDEVRRHCNLFDISLTKSPIASCQKHETRVGDEAIAGCGMSSAY